MDKNKGLVLITVLAVITIVGILIISFFTYLNYQQSFLYHNKNDAQAYSLAISGIKYYNLLKDSAPFSTLNPWNKETEIFFPAGNNYQSFAIVRLSPTDNTKVKCTGRIYRQSGATKTIIVKKTLIYNGTTGVLYDED